MTVEEAIDYLLDPIGKREKHDEAVQMAIDALKKQIPKKPKVPITWVCPVCGRNVECQAIDWGDEG